MSEKLKLEDLKIGMRVKMEQLSEIYDVFIYFDDYDNETGGEIIYVCKEPDDYIMSVVDKTKRMITFHQGSEGFEEDIDIYE